MHKKDYLQRQFEEFGKVLAVILSLKKEKDWLEFEKQLEEAAKKYTPFELAKLEALTEQEFIQEIQAAPALQFDQKKILASLLFEHMNASLEKGEAAKYASLKSKCLALYTLLGNDLTQNEYDLEVHYRLELLRRPE